MQRRHEVRCTLQSIVHSFRIPAIHVNVVVDPVQCIDEFNIPLLSIPHCGPPPVAATVPGSAGSGNGAMHAMKCDPGGKAIPKLNRGVQRRAEATEDEGMGCGTRTGRLTSTIPA